MNLKSLRVELTLKTNSNVAREVAAQVLFRANPHESTLTDSRLREAGVNLESLTRYFEQLALVVGEFWNSCWDMTYETVMKPHEVRNLYLPLMYGVIFASVGNMKEGNYEYIIKARADEKPDRKWIIDFSATLEAMRDIIRGDTGQIGNRGALPQSHVMLTVLSEISEDYRTAEIIVKDGKQVDTALAGLSALVGLTLVEEANRIMYTGVDEVNFRQLTGTIIDKSLVEMKTTTIVKAT